jgi:hypothetical protein
VGRVRPDAVEPPGAHLAGLPVGGAEDDVALLGGAVAVQLDGADRLDEAAGLAAGRVLSSLRYVMVTGWRRSMARSMAVRVCSVVWFAVILIAAPPAAPLCPYRPYR